MPKSRAHKKNSATRNTQRLVPRVKTLANETAGVGTLSTPVTQARVGTRSTGIQGVIMPAMVALGCWGMAFTFIVFSTDPNRLIFGGMAALMALMWSVSFSMRLRKLRQK